MGRKEGGAYCERLRASRGIRGSDGVVGRGRIRDWRSLERMFWRA